ncbi:MAG: TenA family protein [Rhodospirillales bacterium]|nr:TenA family protein [Rhodospirillales bacterium]
MPSDAPLFRRLKTACAAEWAAYTEHAFVKGVADGTLPEACFRRYLAQDYLFLIHFARAYALAAYKGETLADIRQAATGLSAIIDVEMELHIKYCAGWGLGAAALESVPEAEETMAYTRYVLERGLAGDLLDLHVALAPCIVGYGEIGAALAADPRTKKDGNPYWAWIEMYASAEYQSIAAAGCSTLDALMVRRGGEGRLASLIATFRQATQLEAAFWQMGLKAQSRKPIVRP